jgi:hypothetical protein
MPNPYKILKIKVVLSGTLLTALFYHLLPNNLL